MKAASVFRSWEFMLAVVLVLELMVLGLINPAFLNIENLLFSTSDFTHVIIAAIAFNSWPEPVCIGTKPNWPAKTMAAAPEKSPASA